MVSYRLSIRQLCGLAYPQQVSSEMKELKERNKEIRLLYKKGLGGILGRRFGIKRQRIHQIISQKPQDSFWRALWNKLIHWY